MLLARTKVGVSDEQQVSILGWACIELYLCVFANLIVSFTSSYRLAKSD